METVVIFILILFVVVLALVGIFRKTKPAKNLKKENIPENLGAIENTSIQPLISQLELALPDEYINQVKQRFLQQNAKVSEDELEWRIFELKRFFILTGVLKTVPMYSEEVDDVWHEMLMFTQAYQNFSEKFNGSMLHHKPNVQGGGNPDERAFFDWVFSQLFEVTTYSWSTWGDFFKSPLNPALITEFKYKDKEYLKNKYFKITEESNQIVDYLITRLKEQSHQADEMHKRNEKGAFTKQQQYGDFSSTSLIMVFYSIYYYDQYWLMAKAYLYSSASNSSSGCTSAVFCGSATSSDKNSGGDSSCSSGDASCGGGGCSS
ncbi:hypothetical protein [Sutcliffiella sp. NC1]|uniref:hypothetical protein n=1 Tax=Sutcliffiella sp. NC1 TaxID=3004096 RepID=UPI0022DE1FF9|nr:hypothetical protein [Sutcliffiella sp. NC1]WBL16101.1 hypothetical protein O1A01_05550 [Sutcliffiella sp. NC1]